MIRLPRPSLPVAAVGAPIIAGIASGAMAVTSALARDWEVMTMALLATAWAMVAAAWAYRATTHACPPAPAAVERGVQCIHFVGGPEDGGSGIPPGTPRDLCGTTMTVGGADYRVGAVERTCFRAELAPAAEQGGDR